MIFNDDNSITATISKSGKNITECRAIAAVYNNDILSECDIQPVNFTAQDDTQNVNVKFNLNTNPSASIKIFIFDSFEHMIPLSDVYTH